MAKGDGPDLDLVLARAEAGGKGNTGYKGFAPDYRPYKKGQVILSHVQQIMEQLAEADALPVGPRSILYRLMESGLQHPDGRRYDKSDGPKINEVVNMGRRSGAIRWADITDGKAVLHETGGYDDPGEFLRGLQYRVQWYERDRRQGQSTEVEIACEARESLALVRRIASEYGVNVYSSGGSFGADGNLRAAQRAAERSERGVRTVLLYVGDLDKAGVVQIQRPHIEDVLKFYVELGGELALFSTRRVAITVEQALKLNSITDAERWALLAYQASGRCEWTRNPEHLTDAKIEAEALDPRELVTVLRRELEQELDLDQIARVKAQTEADKVYLHERLAGLLDEPSANGD